MTGSGGRAGDSVCRRSPRVGRRRVTVSRPVRLVNLGVSGSLARGLRPAARAAGLRGAGRTHPLTPSHAVAKLRPLIVQTRSSERSVFFCCCVSTPCMGQTKAEGPHRL